MKKVFVFLLAAASVAAISSCKKSSSTPSTTARVMFVNGSAGSSALGLTVNGTGVPNATAVGYLDSSGYQNVSSGTDSVNVVIASIQHNLLTPSLSTTFTAGSSYSIFVGGIITSGTVFVTSDNLTAPTGNNTKVRLVNTCSDAASAMISAVAVSTTTGNTTIDSNIAYQTASPFTQIPAGSYVIKVEGSNLASEQNTSTLQFNAGKIYTVMYSGTNGIYNVTVIPNN